MISARPLTLADIDLPAPPASVISRMRASHHAAARLVAEGKRPAEVAAITGYQPATISNLQNDPAFVSLVALYRENVQAIYIDTHQRMDALAGDAVDELHHRLRETPDQFTVPQLESIAKSFLDRVGFGPSKTVHQTTLTAQVTSDDLARIRAAANSRGEVRQLAEAGAETGDRVDVGLAPAIEAEFHPIPSPPQVVEEAGARVRAESDGVAGE